MSKISKRQTTEYNRFKRVKDQVIGVYRSAHTFKMSLYDLIEAKSKIHETHDYNRLTTYYAGNIAGIEDILFDDIQRNKMIWMHYYTNKNGKVVYVKKWEKLPRYIRENGNFESNHFWKGTTKPFGNPSIGKGIK